MVRRFKRWQRSGLVVLWVAFHTATTGGVYADLIDELCDTGADPSLVIESLVEEAEATGIPPATLSRLLAIGYRDAESVVDLRALLCTIVIMEERGLPPEPLFEKLAEGLGKRASLKSIQVVIMRQAAKLQYAQALLSGGKEPLIDDANVARIADLLDIGVSKDQLDHLFGPAFSSSADMRVVAAEILGYGSIAGFPREELDRLVATGLRSQSLTPEWSYFIKVIKDARNHDIPDEQTAAAAVTILSQKKSMNDLIEYLKLDPHQVYESRDRS